MRWVGLMLALLAVLVAWQGQLELNDGGPSRNVLRGPLWVLVTPPGMLGTMLMVTGWAWRERR